LPSAKNGGGPAFMEQFEWHRERFDLPQASARDVQVRVSVASDAVVMANAIGSAGPLALDVKSNGVSIGRGHSDASQNTIRVFTPELLSVTPGPLTASFRNDGQGTLSLSVAVGIRPRYWRTP
jgi:hypothetical protein